MRSNAGHGRRWAGAAGGALLGLLALAGCGEQDLYKPPQSPFAVSGRVAAPATAFDVAVLGHYAYLAIGEGGLLAIDIQDPDHPRQVYWQDALKTYHAIEAVRTYEPDGSTHDLVYAVEGTEGLVPFDASQLPDSLIPLRGSGTAAYDAQKACFAMPGNMTDSYDIYLADSWRAVTGFVSTPGNPGNLDQKARIETYGYTKDIAMSSDNTHAYVADGEMGVTSIDGTRLRQLQLTVVGNCDLPGTALGIAVEGDFIYVAAEAAGLQVLRAGADYIPHSVASLALPGECVGIAVRDHVAFLTAKDAGLYVVDVRDPNHPNLLGNVVTSYAVGVAVGEGNVVCIADRDEGLVVFRGPDLPADFTPPAMVTDLAARLADSTAVELRWTAPGDDGTTGTAALYHVYRSGAPFDVTTLGQATELARRPVPKPAGTAQLMQIAGLTPGARYYFALRAEDEAHNLAPLSGLTPVVMTVPTLTGTSVAPDSGDVATVFAFRVTYRDPEGDAPSVKTLILDGTERAMSAVSGTDYAAGVVFEYQTTVGRGSHEYQFAFDDGHGPLVRTAVTPGPRTPPDPFEFTMVPITVGVFDMGSPADELGRDDDETTHAVTLTRPYLLGAAEVSQGTYTAVTGLAPFDFPGESRPAENVTFFDALRFCNALSDRQGFTRAYTLAGEVFEGGHVVAATIAWDREANGFRLPTEAEWEFAARAGSTTALANGPLLVEHCEPDAGLDAIGWYCGNCDTGSGPRPHDGARKAPNALGLYDMHGNVWEWCWDIYGAYPDGGASDPTGPAGESWMQRVRRGGSWFYFARDCRSASRDAYWPGSNDNTLGFRLARNAD
jgi:formylglycine-generating enzyme required for sulfatase activity